MRLPTSIVAGLTLAATATGLAWAQGGDIALEYGGETTLYGSCLPTLKARNNAGAPIDYLQVDLSVTLADGRRRVLELKSRYRAGLPNPIAQGEIRTLKINLDEAVPLGGACSDIVAISIAAVDCLGGKDGEPAGCPGKVTPAPGDAIVRPRQ